MAKMSERVLKAMEKPEQIRNIAICAHIDHGKTTFSDNLLSGAGMMSEELAGKARVTDFHEDEQERGITIDSASVSMVHQIEDKEFLINLIDTPGHVDFGGDVTRAMRAVDGSIVLACAVEGVMPQTETVLRQSLKERVKPILFINKVDRLIKEVKLTPEAMQARFIKIIDQVNVMIKKIAEEEYSDKWQVNVMDGSVCFGSAFHNWGLSLPYMKKHNVSFKEIIDAYNDDEAWKELKHKAPIHKVILDGVVEHLPNPIKAQEYRIPKIWHGDLESTDGQSLISCNPKGPMYFVITKIVVDPQAGEIATGRVFSGTVSRGSTGHLNGVNQSMRIQQVFVMNGAKREIVDHVPAGNIIAVGGLKSAPGETVTNEPGEPFEQISHIFEPVVTKAIEAKKPADLPKLIDVLHIVGKEDPSIHIEINEETGEHLMSGMGELHLEVMENRIRKDKGVDIQTSLPIVVYRECILKATSADAEGKSPNKHNKLYFRVEPLEPEVVEAIKKGEIRTGRIRAKKDEAVAKQFVEKGYDSKIAKKVRAVFNGNILIDETRGIVHIGEIIEMVLDMFQDVMNAGPVAHEPCLNVKVRLMDCKLHEDAIHRGPAQLYPAVREGIREAMSMATPLLFEPIQTLQFEAPTEFMGEISKLISNKRGQLIDMQQEGDSVTVIGKLPVGEMFGLSNDLRSATGGRGNYSLVDQNFERLPGELQDKIKKQIRERKGLKVD
ncbi:elongation factor EF-2 [Candidatus Woesearchaeota archaeon]|mgnify:FL=1|jgi:elongation factor 2|nr:elongation factor EF-2 [Candidatus Woesearchaeota archaeon]MBT7366830.1 elongation factor EF-2 [Candidatus Woesearchaeota archaeon]